MLSPYEKLAKILRVDPAVLVELSEKLQNLTGKTQVIEKIVQHNEILVKRTLEELGVTDAQPTAEQVYSALINRIQHMDQHLYYLLDRPDLSKMSMTCGKLCEVALSLNQPQKGFFLKKDRAIDMLKRFPPQNLLDHFGYATVDELIEKQGFSSVFCALRFAQDTQWMHKFFDEAYGTLTAADFEDRDVELKVLETEWVDVAEKFLKHKYHNISHLKELGIIFIVPLAIDIPGETLRMTSLILHYLNEVPFYSRLFRKFSREPNFIANLQSLLRGDVSKGPLPNHGKASLRIVQQYLAKDDVNDPRLLEPHVNPEAEHWYRAEQDLSKIPSKVGEEGHAFGYWLGLDFVGDFFPSEQGGEQLVSFDLIDLAMSLVKNLEIKYLYHQEEALWNKIFIDYLGRQRVEQLIDENIIGGIVTL